MGPAILWERKSRRDSKLGRQILHQDGHRVRPQQYPEKLVAEARATFYVSGEVAGIDIRDAGDEGGSEIRPQLAPLVRRKNFQGIRRRWGDRHRRLSVPLRIGRLRHRASRSFVSSSQL